MVGIYNIVVSVSITKLCCYGRGIFYRRVCVIDLRVGWSYGVWWIQGFLQSSNKREKQGKKNGVEKWGY